MKTLYEKKNKRQPIQPIQFVSNGCVSSVPPDPTPGVMTWEELLEHMDNLVDWGHDELKVSIRCKSMSVGF